MPSQSLAETHKSHDLSLRSLHSNRLGTFCPGHLVHHIVIAIALSPGFAPHKKQKTVFTVSRWICHRIQSLNIENAVHRLLNCSLKLKTDSAQSLSNKCKNYLLKIYSQHGNFLNVIFCPTASTQAKIMRPSSLEDSA